MEQGDRLALVIGAWLALVRDGDAGQLERLLDEAVTWQGQQPELVCRGRHEVVRRLRRLPAQPLRIRHLEAGEIGDRVAISVEGSGFPETDVSAPATPRSLVFVFGGASVVAMESFVSRDAAFAALAA